VIKEGKMKEKSSFSCWGIQFHREKKKRKRSDFVGAIQALIFHFHLIWKVIYPLKLSFFFVFL
jgi:hypothetical protein